MSNKDWEKELEEIKDELLDKVDEYFPKIKPEGRNEGRGESAVIVGIAMTRFRTLLATQKKEERRRYDKSLEDLQKFCKDSSKELLKMQKKEIIEKAIKIVEEDNFPPVIFDKLKQLKQ